MAMRYTHATRDGIRRAMQLLTQTVAGKSNGKVSAYAKLDRHKSPHIKRVRAACAARQCLI